MLYNIIFGFLTPWVLALHWIKKQPLLFIVITPITAIISMLINMIGFFFGFWHVTPIIEKNETISTIPLDLGLYAVLGSLLIYILVKRPLQIHPVFIILISSLFTTFLEYMALIFEYVTYGNGWNIGWTFISYLTAYLCVTTAWIIAREHIEIVK